MELQDKYEDGTSPSEVFALTFVVPASALLFTLLAALSPPITNSLKMLLEAILLNLILLLCMTYFSNDLITVLLLLTMSILIFGLFLWNQSVKFEPVIKDTLSCSPKNVFRDSTMAPKNLTEDFVRDYRGHLLLATSISILAVDFSVFPRKFSKTDTYGWSVMDAGVGSFVFIHGVCSSSARLGSTKGLGKSLASSLPLLFLGFVRLIAVTAVSYHTSISEYGIHWNFFFTLAVTKVVCSFPLCIFSPSYSWIIVFVTVVIHQGLLLGGLTTFILNDDRIGLISANKEGICSLLGFITIYFEGVQFGRLLWRTRQKMRDYWSLLFTMCCIGVLGWILMYFLHDNVQPISRRMANASYCAWVVSLTSLQIGIHLALHLGLIVISRCLEKSTSQLLLSSRDCLLWKAINDNGLFYFLIANLLTGLVNLSVNTESADTPTFFILVTYLMILSVVVIVMHLLQIRIKFW